MKTASRTPRSKIQTVAAKGAKMMARVRKMDERKLKKGRVAILT
jgi:hypothetical protein